MEQKKSYSNRKYSILLVTSTGGHLHQLYQLKPWWKKHRRYWVTSDSPDVTYLLRNEKIIPGHFPESDHIVNAVKNLFLAVITISKLHPDIVISTGAGIAPPFIFVAFLFRIKTVFIEALDFVSSKSLSGRLVYPFTTLFIVQHRELLKEYPKAKYLGSFI